MGGSIVWDFLFRRNLYDHEVIDFLRLLSVLEGIYLSVGRQDERIWKPVTKGQFSVRSFYNALLGADVRMVDWRQFWDSYVPQRILVFSWLTSLQKILTLDHLRRKNCIVVNGCRLCCKC